MALQGFGVLKYSLFLFYFFLFLLKGKAVQHQPQNADCLCKNKNDTVFQRDSHYSASLSEEKRIFVKHNKSVEIMGKL